MKLGIKALATVSAMLFTMPASADTVCDWIDFAQAIESAELGPQMGAVKPTEHAHAQTQVALAMFEALDAIDRRYETYLGWLQPTPGRRRTPPRQPPLIKC